MQLLTMRGDYRSYRQRHQARRRARLLTALLVLAAVALLVGIVWGRHR